MKNRSLISCSQCFEQISPEAVSCPHCGHPHKMYRSFEWRSSATMGSWPLVHVAFGRNKKTGKWLVAKGIIAIGQYAMGVVTIAQFGIGLVFGFGQFVIGYYAIAQFVAGMVAIGQFAFGKYVLAQAGFGEFVWSVSRRDPEAIEYFRHLWIMVKGYFGLD